MSTWKLFQHAMLATTLDGTASESVVLVNIGSVIANHLDPGGDPSLSCDIAKQDTEKKRDEMLERYLQTSPEESGEALCKTVQEARKTTFTFVSMKEYLAEYDWKSELDEEKIKPWLEINEKAWEVSTFEKAGRTGDK